MDESTTNVTPTSDLWIVQGSTSSFFFADLIYLYHLIFKLPDERSRNVVLSSAASVMQWLTLSLSERKIVGSNPPMVVHSLCRSPRLASGYLASAR